MSRLYMLFMGVQGAGKGVQAGLMSSHYHIPHVSTGELFRAMKTRTDELAQQIQATMAAGAYVSDDTTNAVVKERLELPDAAAGAILDGYPRTPGQAQWLDGYLKDRGDRLNVVLYLKLDLYTAFKRAFGRVTSDATGQSFNYFFNKDGIDWQMIEHPQKEYPPRLHAVHHASGEVLTRRYDDANAFGILRRIDTFLTETAPLIAYYQERGVVVEIDAARSIEAVTAAIVAAIAQHRT